MHRSFLASRALALCLTLVVPGLGFAASPAVLTSPTGTAQALGANGAGKPAAPALPRSGTKLPGDAYWPNQDNGLKAVDPLVVPGGPSSVQDVMADQILKNEADRKGIDPMRAQQIQEAALAYGASAGMDARAKEINRVLDSNARNYDHAFNFGALMLEPGVMPPVISEGRDAYNQPSDTLVRAADRVYRIEFPARFVSVQPTWRDYLPVPVTGAPRPDATMLPKDRSEKNLWDQWATEGWKKGIELANETFEANTARLKRDFEGMIRYKALYEQGVVSKPVLASSNLGVTGGGDEMAVGDRIHQITDKAQLDPTTRRWAHPMPVTGQNDRVWTTPQARPTGMDEPVPDSVPSSMTTEDGAPEKTGSNRSKTPRHSRGKPSSAKVSAPAD